MRFEGFGALGIYGVKGLGFPVLGMGSGFRVQVISGMGYGLID